MSNYNDELVQQMRANGKPYSASDNDRLWPKVVAGDEAAKTAMIEGNMSLVISKVDSYIHQFPFAAYLREDLISEGFCGLCEAVNRMSTEPPPAKPNPTGFLSHKIHHFIGAVLDKDSGLGASDRTMRRKRQQGNAIPATVPYEDASIPDHVIDPTSMVELRDLIDACCEDEDDRTIVRMREEGYVDKEIADVIGAPLTTTYMRRREIYARFLEKSEVKGEV